MARDCETLAAIHGRFDELASHHRTGDGPQAIQEFVRRAANDQQKVTRG